MSLSKSEIFLSDTEKNRIRTDFETVVSNCCENTTDARQCRDTKEGIISFCIDHNIRLYNLPSLKYTTRIDLLRRLVNFINTGELYGLSQWKDDFAVFQTSESIGLKEQHQHADKTVKAQHDRTGNVSPETLLTLQDMIDLFGVREYLCEGVLTTQPFSYSDANACDTVGMLATENNRKIFLPIIDDGHWFSLQRLEGVWYLQDTQPLVSGSGLTPRQEKILRNSKNFLAGVHQGNDYGVLAFKTSADQLNDHDCGSRVVNNYRALVDTNYARKTHVQILQEAYQIQGGQGQLTMGSPSANSSQSTATGNTQQSLTTSSSGAGKSSSSSLGKPDQSPGKSPTTEKQDKDKEKEKQRVQETRRQLRLEVEAAEKDDLRRKKEEQLRQEERREQEKQRIEAEKREQEKQRKQEKQREQEEQLKYALPSFEEVKRRTSVPQTQSADSQQQTEQPRRQSGDRSSPRFFQSGSQQENQFLIKLNKLESALNALETKAVEFGQLKGNYDEGSEEHKNYAKAEIAARGLKDDITTYLNTYKHNWNDLGAYQTFKVNSETAVDKYNKSVLSHHRDLSKTIVANVILAILGLGVIYGIVLVVDSAMHHGRRPILWQTQSERQAYTVEDLVDDLAPPTREM